jgi:hypothetical protein
MYYPKSQIKTNLYTNGGEFALITTNQEYIGYYWSTSTGKNYSGKTPDDIDVVELITLPQKSPSTSNSISNYIVTIGLNEYYNNIKQLKSQTLFLPTYYQPQPTQQDYQIGEFRRYFTKKTNELLYTEVSKDTYDNILNKNSQWLWQDYLAFNIPWSISGDKLTVAKTNKNIVDLTIKNLILPKFNDYLRNDYLKFYK